MCEHCGCRGVEPIAALMDEHHASDAASLLDRAVAALSAHIDREDLGIFPVAVVTLGASGWNTVDTAHARGAPAAS